LAAVEVEEASPPGVEVEGRVAKYAAASPAARTASVVRTLGFILSSGLKVQMSDL
jgi:hypothetical protein